MLKGVFKIFLWAFLILWLGGAWVRFFNEDWFLPSLPVATSFGERAIESLKAAFFGVPHVLSVIRGWLGGPASSVGQAFSGEIGAVQAASSPLLEQSKATVIFVALYAWRAVILPLSILQFCLYFVLRGFGASVLWDYPGIPRLEKMTAKAAAWIALGVVGYGIAANAYAAGVWASVAAAIALPLVLLFPVVGTLPLWIMQKVLRIDPYDLFRLSLRALERAKSRSEEREEARQAETVSPVPKAPPRDTAPLPSSPQRPEAHSELRHTAGPSASSVGPTYESACKTLGFVPHAFTQVEVATKYRELMRGSRGTPERTKSINLAYEAVLAAHGWSR